MRTETVEIVGFLFWGHCSKKLIALVKSVYRRSKITARKIVTSDHLLWH